MKKSSKNPESLSEAIARLEAIGQTAAGDLKDRFSSDYDQIKEALDLLKPHLENLKNTAEEKVKDTKDQVENKMQQNPWVVVGIAGLIGIFIGWILGSKKR